MCVLWKWSPDTGWRIFIEDATGDLPVDTGICQKKRRQIIDLPFNEKSYCGHLHLSNKNAASSHSESHQQIGKTKLEFNKTPFDLHDTLPAIIWMSRLSMAPISFSAMQLTVVLWISCLYNSPGIECSQRLPFVSVCLMPGTSFACLCVWARWTNRRAMEESMGRKERFY